jgi:hypothetical protein
VRVVCRLGVGLQAIAVVLLARGSMWAIADAPRERICAAVSALGRCMASLAMCLIRRDVSGAGTGIGLGAGRRAGDLTGVLAIGGIPYVAIELR